MRRGALVEHDQLVELAGVEAGLVDLGLDRLARDRALGLLERPAGLIDGAWLSAQTPIQEADYYLCGPRPFLRALVAELSQAGVSSDRIHYEFFGPAQALDS